MVSVGGAQDVEHRAPRDGALPPHQDPSSRGIWIGGGRAVAIAVNTATLVGSAGGASLLTPAIHDPTVVVLVFVSLMLSLYLLAACTLVLLGRIGMWSARRRGRPRREPARRSRPRRAPA